MPLISVNKANEALSFTDFGPRDGFPILAQHGLIASIKHGDLFQRLVEAGARVICIARPGYGDSSPVTLHNIGDWGDLVGVVIKHLGLTRFDVLGMSSGAPYAYAIADSFPEQVRHVYIFSGIPAMYDEAVLAKWPFEIKKDSNLEEMKKLAHGLFFSNLSAQDLANDDVRDSMSNDGFGIAQDFLLRCCDWGFTLDQVRQPVFMRHARQDHGVPYETALITSKMLPDARFFTDESEIHFSQETLDDFFEHFLIPNLST